MEWQKNPAPESGTSYSFKADYIDDSSIASAREKMAADSSMLIEIPSNTFAKGEVDLVTQVDNFFATFGRKVTNPVLGEIKIDKKSVKASLGHGIGRLKAAAFAAVPTVIENGYIIDFQKNWKDRGYDTAVIGANISIGGEPYMVGVVVEGHAERNDFYTHEVAIYKNGETPFKTAVTKNGLSGGDSPSIDSILREIGKVKERFFTTDAPTSNDESTGVKLSRVIDRSAAEFSGLFKTTDNGHLQLTDASKLTDQEWSEIAKSFKRLGYEIHGGKDAKAIYTGSSNIPVIHLLNYHRFRWRSCDLTNRKA